MNKKLRTALLLSTCLLFIQCSKNKDTAPASPPVVYAEENEFNGSHDVAKVCRDNVSVSLSDGQFNTSANAVFVSGTDVYVAGYEFNNNNILVAKVWKNDTSTALTGGSIHAEASEVFVAGTDVYVVGYFPK